ncbi:MAG: 16S rRNA (uracil(1498)-N(3))-methyltransferase [Dysgonamonadaceae bacterium]
MNDTLFYYSDIRHNPQLPEQESKHCIKVLRMKEGDSLMVTDGKGAFYECTLLDSNPKNCTLSIDNIIEQPKSWNFNLHIAFAPTKNMDRNEWFVEKATEIGVDRLTPLNCRFSERKEIKKERLEKILISAMKQSQQAYLPLLDEMISFSEFIAMPFDGKKYIAHCYKKEKVLLSKAYSKEENALVLIGPEGDFSENEIELALQHEFEPISLGDNRLRTETACLAACHTIHVLNQL